MKYGCKPEIEDKRDYKVRIAKSICYPNEYKIKMPKVKNQGAVNSCVAHALSTFLEEYYKLEQKEFSVGFIYGYRPDGYYQGEGMYPREAIKTLQKVGDVENKYFNYNKEMTGIKELVNNDIDKLQLMAEEYKIESYARIYTINEIKDCLYNDVPVPISIPVKNNLSFDKDYVIKNEGSVEGYHMVILYGWNEKGFLLQNSWGENWGNKGRAVLPYDYTIDSAWALSTKANNIEPYQTLWQQIKQFLIKILTRFLTYIEGK